MATLGALPDLVGVVEPGLLAQIRVAVIAVAGAIAADLPPAQPMVVRTALKAGGRPARG